KRLVSLATLFVLALSLVGCRTKPKPNPAPPAGPDFTVKAGDLLKEYSGNALAADSKYKGKVLRVSGKCNSVQKAPLLGYVVQLLPEDAGDLNASYVQCVITDSAEPDVVKLKAGDMVTLQGTCDGQVVAQVKLSKCVVVK